MKRYFLIILLPIILLSCSTKNVSKISWEGNLINKMEEVNYLYWNDGNQFVTKYQDSIRVSLAGFDYDNSVYILLSITNEKKHPITFFNTDCELTYKFGGQEIKLLQTKPKNIDQEHFSLFNTILNGANSISRLFLSVPVDALLGGNSDESNSPGNITAEYQDEKQNMSKKIFINNHTLFPEMNYTGVLVFEYEEDKSITKRPFNLMINTGANFVFQGLFNY